MNIIGHNRSKLLTPHARAHERAARRPSYFSHSRPPTLRALATAVSRKSFMVPNQDGHTPPSVQVITALPYDPWKPSKLYRFQAVANASVTRPIHGRVHAGHAQGCKVCFCGTIPCPICMYVVPCSTEDDPTDEPGCICPCPCIFGVPIPNWFVCAGISCPCDEYSDHGRGQGDSWIFRGEGSDSCECIVVDRESGMINVYPADCCGDQTCCTCVPISKVPKVLSYVEVTNENKT